MCREVVGLFFHFFFFFLSGSFGNLFKCTQFTKVCGQQGVGLLKVGLSQIQNHCRGCYKWVFYQLLAKCLLYQLTMNEIQTAKFLMLHLFI